jgi:hypothetical protein
VQEETRSFDSGKKKAESEYWVAEKGEWNRRGFGLLCRRAGYQVLIPAREQALHARFHLKKK